MNITSFGLLCDLFKSIIRTLFKSDSVSSLCLKSLTVVVMLTFLYNEWDVLTRPYNTTSLKKKLQQRIDFFFFLSFTLKTISE